MNDLMSQAADLMLAGMGFVFAFLIILVFATTLMSKLLLRFPPPAPATPARTP
ncbi:MAG: OadG family protein, partial [Alteromonadaceae bacterium]|nr:OadG family protein [Alteromonadaceae bacterium]